MKNLYIFGCLTAICFGMLSGFVVDHRSTFEIKNAAGRASDGAFQDGLYLGRLAAKRGAESHIAIGRWATTESRTSFTAGYQKGFNDVLASRVSPEIRSRQVE
jgi:hypothetical protein